MTEIVKHIKNLLKTTTLLLILVSIVTPFAYQMTQVFAQDYDVQMEVKYKDGSRQSIFKTKEALIDEPLPEIQPAGEIPEVKTEFSIEQVEEIDKAGGVNYDRHYVASVDEAKLKELGYTSEEIADIAKMVDWYNSSKVLSVEVIDLSAKREAKKVSLGVTASAAPCEPKLSYRWEIWGYEVDADECGVNQLKRDHGYLGAYIAAFAFTPCNLFCGGYGIYQALVITELEHANGQCENGGAILRMYHGGIWNVSPRC